MRLYTVSKIRNTEIGFEPQVVDILKSLIRTERDGQNKWRQVAEDSCALLNATP